MKVKVGEPSGGKRRIELLHDTVSDEVVVRVYEVAGGYSDARIEAQQVRRQCKRKREPLP